MLLVPMIRSRSMWLGTAQNQHQTCRFFCCCRIFATVCSFFFLLAVFVGCHAVSLTPLNAYRPMPPQTAAGTGRLSWPHCPGLRGGGNDSKYSNTNVRCFRNLSLENWVATVRLRQALFHWNLDAQSLFHERVSRMLVMLGPSVFPITFGPLLSGHPSTIRLHLDICDNFDAENNAHGGNAWVGRIWRCCLMSSSALSICPLVQCPFNSIRSLTSRGHCSFTYMVYTHVTLNIHVYSPHTQTHNDTHYT